MKMLKKLFLLCFMSVIIIACSSNDDFNSNNNLVTSNLTSTEYSFVKSDSRIISYEDYISGITRSVDQSIVENLGVISNMSEAPEVPSNVQSFIDVKSWNINNSAKYFIPAEQTYNNDNTNLGGTEIYVQGTMNLANYWGVSSWGANGQTPAKVYVLPGGTLNYNTNLPMQFNLYNYGTVNCNNSKKEFYVQSSTGAFLNYGDLNLGEDIDVRVNNAIMYVGGDVKDTKNLWVEVGGKTYIGGDLNLNTDLDVQGTLVVQGKVTASNIYLKAFTKFAAGCKVITPGLFKIDSNNAAAWINYLSANDVYACASSKMYLYDGGMIEVANIYENQNNGNDAALILLGNNSRGVLKANIIANNTGDGVTQDLISYRVDQPETGSILTLVADKFYNTNGVNVLKNEISKSNISHDSNVYIDDDDIALFSMTPTDCSPGFNYNGNSDKDDNTPDVVIVPPVHKYSATALDFGPNGKLYLCWHSNIGNGIGGNGTNMYVSNEDGSSVSVDGITDWGGIIDVINTNNYGDPHTYLFDQTLIQNEHKYNHVIYYGNKLYLASTSKKVGAAMHEIELNSDGTINENEFSEKNYRVKLTGSSANSAIINNDNLITISGFNNGGINKFPITDFSNQEKKAIITRENFAGKYIYNQGTFIITLNNVQKGTVTIYNQDMQMVRSFNVGAIYPEDGKNVIVGDNTHIYVCRGNNGLAIYDYQGNRVGGTKKSANGVDFDNKYIYVATGLGLIVLDRNITYTDEGTIYNKTIKRYVYSGIGNSRYNGIITANDVKQSANFVKVRNGKAYVAYGMYGLQIYDVSELY